MLDSGLAVMMNKHDARWCTQCSIYILVNFLDDRRVYVKAAASPINPILSNRLKRFFLANEGRTECLAYTMYAPENDQIYHVNNFQGAADIFVGRKSRPYTKNSSSVKLLSESANP